MTIDWQSLLAAIASIAAVFVLARLGFHRNASTAFGTLAVGMVALAYVIDFVARLINNQSALVQNVSDLMWLLVAATLLVSLANFLREDKPPFARYPFFFTLLPLIVLPVYPFISDTIVIKNWVLALYQFGALIISGLLFSLMTTKDKSYSPILVAIAFFSIAWITKWIVQPPLSDRWVYTICVTVGMILAAKTFYDRANQKPITKTN